MVPAPNTHFAPGRERERERLQEFREFPLQSIEEMTHNVRRFRVGLPSEEHVMGMTTASCIVIKGKGKDGSVAVRPYTPTTTNDTKVCLRGVCSVPPCILSRPHKYRFLPCACICFSFAIENLRRTACQSEEHRYC